MERRKFLKDTLKVGLGLTAGLAAGGISFASTKSAPPLPWPYVKLDPKKIADYAYSEFYRHECCNAVFSSIIRELARKVGEPYTNLPLTMMWYGGGGIAGWGTICGTLNGAALVFNLPCKDFKSMIDVLFDWYQKTALPTYLPCEGPYCKKPFPKSVSHSPLCHVSVQRWCKVASVYFGRPILYNSKERSERCARLAATVAAKAVELLNAYHFEGFKPHKVKGAQKTKMDCRMCHEVVMKEIS